MSTRKAFSLAILILFNIALLTNSVYGQTIKVMPDVIYSLKDSCINFLPMRNDTLNSTTKIISISFNPFHSNATIEILDDSTIRYCDVIPSIFIEDTLTYRIFDFLSGKTDTGFIIIKKALRNSENVWSGDANNDGICNELDVLIWANVFNKKGLARHQVSTQWAPMAMKNIEWQDTSSLKTFSYYSDANGDNTIDLLDADAFIKNFGKSHSLIDTIMLNSITDFSYPIVPVELEILNTNLTQKDTLNLRVNVSNFSNPIISITGIAFTIEYDPTIFKNNQAFLYNSSNSWISSNTSQKYSMIESISQAGQLHAVDTRLSRTKNNGGGGVGDIKIIIDDVIIQSAKLSGKDLIFNIKDVYLIGGNNDLFIRTSLKGDTIKNAQLQYSSIHELSNTESIFMTQTDENIILNILDKGLIGSTLKVINAMGSIQIESILTDQYNKINIESLMNGIYFLEITNPNLKPIKTIKLLQNK